MSFLFRISSVLLPQSSASPLPFYSAIAQRSGGRSLRLAESEGISVLSSLVAGLREVVSVDSQVAQTIHVKKVRWVNRQINRLLDNSCFIQTVAVLPNLTSVLRDRQTDRQIDRQIYRQIDRYIDGQIDRQIDRQIDSLTYRSVDSQIVRLLDSQIIKQFNRHIGT